MTESSPYFLLPDWSVSKRVKAYVTTRVGGVSQAPFDTMNLATHVGDNSTSVAQNRALLKQRLDLPAEPRWLEQVHGTEVADSNSAAQCKADAFYTNKSNIVCSVLTADCLPVFIAERDGKEVAVAHAGWKGLLKGVIEHTVGRFECNQKHLSVWLGPAIGPKKFEVGAEVVAAFKDEAGNDDISYAFTGLGEGNWLADIYGLARFRLQRLGINNITGGNFCTVTDRQMFYSYRRDGVTGRMASLIWIT